MEHPHDKYIAGNPTDTFKWVPNRSISGFSGVRPDRDHATTPAVHQRRPGSDLNGLPEITHSSVRCFEWDILVHLSHSITSSY
jgi:hypothetical protein